MSSALKKKADTLFSKYIRLKYADSNGYVKCVTCGVKKHYKDSMDAGHYVPRNHLSTRWLETNVHVQCRGCNRFGGGRLDEYALFLTKTYGNEVLDYLNKKKHTTCKMTKADYETLIEDLKLKIKELEGRIA